MEKERLKYLIKKYQLGKCTEEEKIEIFEIVQGRHFEKDILLLWEQIYEEIKFDYGDENSDLLYERILGHKDVRSTIQFKSKSKTLDFKVLRSRKVITIAAILIIFIGFSFFIFRLNHSENVGQFVELHDVEVLPGSTKARIVFEDGTFKELGKSQKFDGSKVTGIEKGVYQEGISYQALKAKGDRRTETHTLITPVGGEYSVRLEDGTRIWLNADSKLKYPVSFRGLEARIVELEGEAYFDVAAAKFKNKRQPFIVKTKEQKLEVLGTEFNINTFKNKITTTLIEGSVQMVFEGNDSRTIYKLKPSEQSIYEGHSKKVKISPIDPYYAVAWKNGDFAFDHAPLESVMDDIARWYGVSIDIRSDVRNMKITGKVSKFENIETLLQMIEWTGSVKLKLEGRRVVVM